MNATATLSCSRSQRLSQSRSATSMYTGLRVATADLSIDDCALGFRHEHAAANALDHALGRVQIFRFVMARTGCIATAGVTGRRLLQTFAETLEQHPCYCCGQQRKNNFPHKRFQKTRSRMLTEAAPIKTISVVLAIFRRTRAPPQNAPVCSYCPR